jgi:hypothetical protein
LGVASSGVTKGRRREKRMRGGSAEWEEEGKERGRMEVCVSELEGREKRKERKRERGCCCPPKKGEKKKRKERKKEEKRKREGEWDMCQCVSGWEKIMLSSHSQPNADTWQRRLHFI